MIPHKQNIPAYVISQSFPVMQTLHTSILYDLLKCFLWVKFTI